MIRWIYNSPLHEENENNGDWIIEALEGEDWYTFRKGSPTGPVARLEIEDAIELAHRLENVTEVHYRLRNFHTGAILPAVIL
jgi:hypothetical protein